MARDNRMLGVFQLIGIPPAPRGIPQVEVTFDIDANGILNVTAKDKATNNEQKITITSSSGLSKDEVDKMAKDAEAHAAEDNKRKDEIDARNRADSMVYQVEKMLKDHRDKISDGRCEATSKARSKRTRKAMNGGSVEDINKAVDTLTAGQPQAGGGDVQIVDHGRSNARRAGAERGWRGSVERRWRREEEGRRGRRRICRRRR